MGELRTLLTLELRSLYDSNKARYTKDPKEIRRHRSMRLAWMILIVVAFVYVGGLAYGLCNLGLGSVVPAYLSAISSLLILTFGLFTAGNRIFGQKGYDILTSMPIKTGAIVISRFLSLYVGDLTVALAVILPGTAVYGYCCRPEAGFYLRMLLCTLFIPAIPLVISTLLGTLILAISSRMKGKNIMQTLLMVLLVVGVMLGSFGAEGIANSMTPEQFAQLAQTISGAIGKLYPPALWVGSAVTQGSLAGLGLFLLISAAVMAAAIWIATANFHGILRRLRSFGTRNDYQIGAMKHTGLLKALYLRELKRYFASSIYVTNTIIGPILGTFMAVALCITGLDTIQSALPVDVAGLLPVAFGAVFCMMTTTSVAVSMEGKQFWVVKSLPVPAKTLLDSKILLNLSLMAPFYLVSLVAMAIAIRPDALALLWLILIPASVMLFSTVIGITVNLKFHSFDWEKEETVVKQSLSAMLGGFAGFFLSVAFGGILLVVPVQLVGLAKALMCLLILAVTACLYRKNNQAQLEAL